MIEKTEVVNELLVNFDDKMKNEILKLAWDACCDGALLTEEYGEINFDPWDGLHDEQRRVIEFDMVLAAIDAYKKEDNYENKITIEQFLFGGEFWPDGDRCRAITLEGFHCVTKPDEFPEIFASFKTFEETVAHLCDQYGWNAEEMTTVGIEEATQTFDIGDIEEVEPKQWYETLFTKSMYEV